MKNMYIYRNNPELYKIMCDIKKYARRLRWTLYFIGAMNIFEIIDNYLNN